MTIYGPMTVAERTSMACRAKTRRAIAYQRLGVTEAAVLGQPQITPQLRQIYRAIRKGDANIPADPIYYLRASMDEDARKLMEVYQSIPKVLRGVLPLEAFCLAAGVSTLRVLEIITVTCVRAGATASAIIAHVNHPRVVEKTIEMALTNEGHDDRVILHKAVGFLPTPKGSQTTINLSAKAEATSQAQAASVPAPPPEDSIRRLANRFNDRLMEPARPALPAEIVHETLPETMPHESLEAVELSAADDGTAEEDEEDAP